jgi:hypothetical protein
VISAPIQGNNYGAQIGLLWLKIYINHCDIHYHQNGAKDFYIALTVGVPL